MGRGSLKQRRVPAAISQHLAYIDLRSPRRIIAAYLVRVLEAAYGWMRHESSGIGSTRAALTCSFLRDLRLPTPPIQEQEGVIAWIDEHCSRIDSLTACTEGLIQRLQEYRQAVVTAAVTGQLNIRAEEAA